MDASCVIQLSLFVSCLEVRLAFFLVLYPVDWDEKQPYRQDPENTIMANLASIRRLLWGSGIATHGKSLPCTQRLHARFRPS